MRGRGGLVMLVAIIAAAIYALQPVTFHAGFLGTGDCGNAFSAATASAPGGSIGSPSTTADPVVRGEVADCRQKGRDRLLLCLVLVAGGFLVGLYLNGSSVRSAARRLFFGGKPPQ